MRDVIRFLRGESARLPILDLAEPAFTTDTKKLYIGTGTGNVEIPKKEDVDVIATQAAQNEDILSNLTNKTELLLNHIETENNATRKLISLLANHAIVRIDLAKANFIIDGMINLANKEIYNGTLTFLTHGKLVIGAKGKVRDVLFRIEGNVAVPEVILINRSNAHLQDVTIESTGPSLRMTTAIRIKGEVGMPNTAHTLLNIKIKSINKGFHIDTSESWVTDVNGVNFTITDFGDVAFAVAPDTPGVNQNSHHNFSNIVLQDTRTTTTPRIGFLIGGSWANYTNLGAFADGDTATFIPFAMPETINGSNLIVRAIANNFTNVVLEGNNLKCRGYEYLHNFVNLTILDSWDKRMNFLDGNPELDWGGKVRVSIKNNVLPPTADLTKFGTTLATHAPTQEQYGIYLPSTSRALVNDNSVTVSLANDGLTVKNNTANVLSNFNVDFYVSNEFRKQLRQGRFLTGVFYTENDVSTAEVQDFFKVMLLTNDGIVLADNIMHRYLTGEGQCSAFIAERTGSMSSLTDGKSLVFRFNLTNLQPGKTYKIKDVQLYNQAVPIINENTKKWMTTNYMSSSTL